eukprot:CAMPEP_0170271450 /NCGR_PEP_ID=MMETSP0116_2-20130129/35673_1 /TAXON_ID=400756 /ORGANISM="Durinskia baltica, Strain CSIRO CS-38" /LENGTH=259 /DNA_ID=CAMNT_0010522649 /DNA_START=96 /DNA_END=875 /DNA_ORIENTATION=-
MAESAATLKADCDEVRSMLDRATRPNVQRELQRLLGQLEAEYARAESAGTPAAVPAAAPAPANAPSASNTAAGIGDRKPLAAAAAPAAARAASTHAAAGPWTEITTFALDLGGYSSPQITVDIRLKGVEQLPADSVTCDFTEASFDLKVMGLEGKNYRFLRTNLEKDIVPGESSVKVKKNHVVVTLQKEKDEFGYSSWSDLCAKGKRKSKADKPSDPSAGIMDLMKDLYEDGDDNTKKLIGEAMYKARRGEKFEPKDDM